MRYPTSLLLGGFFCVTALPITRTSAKTELVDFRIAENLDRGLVAMKRADGSVYLSWRFLSDDTAETSFGVHRTSGKNKATKLADVSDSTNFVDTDPPPTGMVDYHIVTKSSGKEPAISKTFTVNLDADAKDYLSIDLAKGVKGFMKPAVGDLDGDGSLDYVIQTPDSYMDPEDGAWHKSDRTFKIHAHASDGRHLWMNDLGPAIEMGTWYSPRLVFDLDGDGKAEVALKTGETINEPNAKPERDKNGRVIDKHEYLSIWNGEDGKELARIPWPDREGFSEYNTASRNQIGIAYLDGKNPSIIAVRGTYGLIKVAAFRFSEGKLTKTWQWESTDESEPGYHADGSRDGAGSHFLHAADVDADGKDELVLGSFVLDDDGTGLWVLKRTDSGKSSPGGHPDGVWVGDILPTRPGLEIFLTYEKWQKENGACLIDAHTGKVLWGIAEKSGHFHKAGMCADIDARHPGMECYGKDFELSTRDINHAWLWAADGTILAKGDETDWGLQPWTAYWDADPQREIILKESVTSYPEGEKSLTMEGCDRTILVADIMGDWREEIIRSTKNNELRIYISTIPSTTRRPTLLHDPIYRADVAHNSMGYAQSPMPTKSLEAE